MILENTSEVAVTHEFNDYKTAENCFKFRKVSEKEREAGQRALVITTD